MTGDTLDAIVTAKMRLEVCRRHIKYIHAQAIEAGHVIVRTEANGILSALDMLESSIKAATDQEKA